MLRGIKTTILGTSAFAFLFTISVSICFADDFMPLMSEEYCPQADLDGDCFVNFSDMAVLARDWLVGAAPCPAGFEDCDANSANGCETNISSDINNCGDCDYVCPAIPHGTVGCQDSNCIVAGCDAGWGNCDSNTANGCETNILTNPSHCGSCGYVCNIPHAIEGCSGGDCYIIGCETGYANCDGNTANGCEAYLDDGGGSCAAATTLGSVCGDHRTGTFCTLDNCDFGPTAATRGEKWYRVYVQECESCTTDLHFWAKLQVPANIDYDLYLYSSCGVLVDSSTNGAGQMETVDYAWDDTGGDDSRYIYIEVR